MRLSGLCSDQAMRYLGRYRKDEKATTVVFDKPGVAPASGSRWVSRKPTEDASKRLATLRLRDGFSKRSEWRRIYAFFGKPLAASLRAGLAHGLARARFPFRSCFRGRIMKLDWDLLLSSS